MARWEIQLRMRKHEVNNLGLTNKGTTDWMLLYKQGFFVDWGRLGMDGKPRPINIQHGKNNIQWDRTTEWTRQNLVNRIEKVAEGQGWVEERTGLHEFEFIETRRHWFTEKVYHHTDGGVNVICLVEGREVVVESPTNAFGPFVVHYAETFIVPASVGEYTIRPYGESEGKQCVTMKAFVR